MGQKLSDLTSQRVIVLILAMLIMIPGFNWNSGLYGDYNSNFFGGLSILHDAFLASGNTTGFQQVSLSPRSSCPCILHGCRKSPFHRKRSMYLTLSTTLPCV